MSWDKLSIHKIHRGMSFKDLASFNATVLSKQGQKIQTDVDSLVTRLFKAKYFAHTDFFGSNIGTNTSYVWGSIFSAKNVVNHGARWCIGTSARIPLMGHPWLLNGECITTSQTWHVQFHSICVNELIDQTTKTWKEQLVHYLFDQHTACSILNTPIFPQVTKNA